MGSPISPPPLRSAHLEKMLKDGSDQCVGSVDPPCGELLLVHVNGVVAACNHEHALVGYVDQIVNAHRSLLRGCCQVRNCAERSRAKTN